MKTSSRGWASARRLPLRHPHHWLDHRFVHRCWTLWPARRRCPIGLLIAWANAAEQVAVVALFRYAKDKKMPKIYQDQGMTVYTFGNAQTV